MNISHGSLRFGAKASAEQVQYVQANYGGDLVHPEMTFSYEPHTSLHGLRTQIANPAKLQEDSLNLRAWKQEEIENAGKQPQENAAPVKDVFLILNQPKAEAAKVRKLVGKHFVDTYNNGHTGIGSMTLNKNGMRVMGSQDKTIVRIPFRESLVNVSIDLLGGLLGGMGNALRTPQPERTTGPDLRKPAADS